MRAQSHGAIRMRGTAAVYSWSPQTIIMVARGEAYLHYIDSR